MNQMTVLHIAMSSVHTALEPGITPEQLSRFDLNLLVAFDALARTRSVTLAAQRLGVTQSAVSHALRRLRDLLGDPLLVRGRGGMVLTPRAQALVVPLRGGLNTLGRALTEPAEWSPRTAQRAFCLATPDLFDVLVVPRLLARVRSEAPGVDITLVSTDLRRLPDQLESGEVDAAVIPQIEELEPSEANSSGLVRRVLFRDRHTCLLRKGHPALRKRAADSGKLSLETYAGLSHLVVSPTGSGSGLVDRALEKHGLRRRIALRVPHFYSALAIVASCDLILTAPTGLARVAPEGAGVRTLEPPLRLPSHHVNLVWHERMTKDPGHSWLRELVHDLSREAVH